MRIRLPRYINFVKWSVIMAFRNLAYASVLITATVFAQDKPGIDRPIRVGSFMGTGTGKYWHANIQQGQTALATMFTSPSTTGLGTDLVVPPKGFTYAKFGVTCENCSPTAAQTTAFIAALDTLDVVYIGCFVDLGSIVSNATQRDRLKKFITTKGYLGVHATTDSYGTWADLDLINATRFENHPNADRVASIRRDSVAQTNPDWVYLNKGLFANGTDTSFTEEWFSYTTSGTAIRSGNSMGTQMVTTKMDEASYAGGMGGAKQMGDHPMSWARRFTEGGRMFYTGVGHRLQNYQGGANPRFLRRQIYNGVLWVAKYDSLSTTVGIRKTQAPGRFADYSRLTVLPSSVKVNVFQRGEHEVVLSGLDGRNFGTRKGNEANGAEYTFGNLKSGVYALNIYTTKGRVNQLVTVP